MAEMAAAPTGLSVGYRARQGVALALQQNANAPGRQAVRMPGAVVRLPPTSHSAQQIAIVIQGWPRYPAVRTAATPLRRSSNDGRSVRRNCLYADPGVAPLAGRESMVVDGPVLVQPKFLKGQRVSSAKASFPALPAELTTPSLEDIILAPWPTIPFVPRKLLPQWATIFIDSLMTFVTARMKAAFYVCSSPRSSC